MRSAGPDSKRGDCIAGVQVVWPCPDREPPRVPDSRVPPRLIPGFDPRATTGGAGGSGWYAWRRAREGRGRQGRAPFGEPLGRADH